MKVRPFPIRLHGPKIQVIQESKAAALAKNRKFASARHAVALLNLIYIYSMKITELLQWQRILRVPANSRSSLQSGGLGMQLQIFRWMHL